VDTDQIKFYIEVNPQYYEVTIMFFVDKPYVSELLKKTVSDNGIPVVGTNMAKNLDLYGPTNLISEDRAVEMARNLDDLSVYTTSENALGWIAKHLAFTGLPEK
jgi:hypothetical protein